MYIYTHLNKKIEYIHPILTACIMLAQIVCILLVLGTTQQNSPVSNGHQHKCKTLRSFTVILATANSHLHTRVISKGVDLVVVMGPLRRLDIIVASQVYSPASEKARGVKERVSIV